MSARSEAQMRRRKREREEAALPREPSCGNCDAFIRGQQPEFGLCCADPDPVRKKSAQWCRRHKFETLNAKEAR